MGGWSWDGPDDDLAGATHNSLRLARVVERLISLRARDATIAVSARLLRGLHRITMEGLRSDAGTFRSADELMFPLGGKHIVPIAAAVSPFVEEMCAATLDRWAGSTPAELAAYALWRTCWIHPFSDGNGRVARALAYVVLCVRMAYYYALDCADAAARAGRTDVRELSALLAVHFAGQLSGAPAERTRER